MKNCDVGVAVQSSLPDFARNAHGNLAEQNRLVGAQHGVNTTVAPATSLAQSANSPAAANRPLRGSKNGVCYGDCFDQNLQLCGLPRGGHQDCGPRFQEIGKKYDGQPELTP